MNPLLNTYVMEDVNPPVEKLDEVSPDELPEIESKFQEAVVIDNNVESHMVNLESLEDVISDVKQVVDQQKINLAEMKDEAGVNEDDNNNGGENNSQDGSGEQATSEQPQSDSSSDSSTGEGGESGSDEGSDGTESSSSDAGESSDESSGGDSDSSEESGDDPESSDPSSSESSSEEGSDNAPEGDDNGSEQSNANADNEPSDEGDNQEEKPQEEKPEEGGEKESQDGNGDSGNAEGESGEEKDGEEPKSDEAKEDSDDGEKDEKSEEPKEESEDDKGDEKKEETDSQPELDSKSSEEDVDKQIAQESLVLANCGARLGIGLSIKNASVESIYQVIGVNRKTASLESNVSTRERNISVYRAHHESFVDVLQKFAVVAKDGLIALIKKVIQLFKTISSNYKRIVDNAKNEIKLVGSMISDGFVIIPGGDKVPLKDIRLTLTPESGIDLSILSGVNYSKLMENEDILVEQIIKASTDFRQEGYVKNDNWAQQILKLLSESQLTDIGYTTDKNKPVYFMGNGVGYGIRTDRFGNLHLDPESPSVPGGVMTADRVMECVQFALETLPMVNSPYHKAIIDEGLKFLDMMILDTNYIHGSRELVMLVRGIQARQLSTIRSARQIRDLVLITARNQTISE